MTAGVALAGAGAIAFSTVTAPPPDVYVAAPSTLAAAPRIVTADIEPIVLASALQILAAGAVGSVEESFHALQYDTVAIWDQIVEQWPDITKVRQNHSLLGTLVLAPVAPLLVGPFTDAVAEVVALALPEYGDEIRQGIPEAVDYAFARLVGPLLSAIGATGAVHEEYYNAGQAGDTLGQNLALLRSPITVLDGFLNGGYGDLGPLLTGEVGGPPIPAPGVLTPWGQWPKDRLTPEAPEDSERSFSVFGGVLEVSAEDEVIDELPPPEEVAELVEGETALVPVATLVGQVDEVQETTEAAAATTAEEPKVRRPGLRQGLENVRDSVRKLTGAGREDAKAESADATTPAAESKDAADSAKTGTTEKADKSEKSAKAERKGGKHRKADKPKSSDSGDSGTE